jgi:hypothetical protein
MTIPASGPAVRDQLDLLVEAAGRPQVTLYLPTPSATEDAARQFDVRRRHLESELAAAGAPDGAAEVMAAALAAHHHSDGETLLLVADAERVLLDQALRRPVRRQLVRVGPAPALLPALRAEQDDLYHVAVLLDREGADVWVRSGLGPADEHATVAGDTEHIHRGHPGGWSQRRFQQRAEGTWDANARLVVDEVRGQVDLDRVDHLVVAGDERAVGFFVAALPAGARQRMVEVDGSRHADHDLFLDAVDTAIRSAAKQAEVGEIRQLRDELAADTAVEGIEVLSLLSQGRVEVLFVADDTDDDDRLQVPFSTDPLLAGPMAEEAGPAGHGPASDLAVLIAHSMGSEIHVLPSRGARNPHQGLGARLRG